MYLTSLDQFVQIQIEGGNNAAQSIVQNSLDLSQNTFESWNRVWELAVAPDSVLWQSLIDLGAFLAGISMIYIIIKEANANSLSYRRLVSVVQLPLFVILFLSGNGKILADVIKAIRAIALFWMSNIQKLVLADISISEAIQKIQNTTVANGRAREIFSECLDLAGDRLQECLQDPNKVQQAQQLLSNLGDGNSAPLQGNIAQRIINGLLEGYIQTKFPEFASALQFILGILQWAFMNGIESALLLSALFAPIAIGFSAIPSAGPSIFKWFSGYLSLLLMQIGYITIVGFTAMVIALSENSSQSFGTIYSDLAFLAFLALIAPIMAVAISKGTGDGIYNAMTRGVQAGLSTATALGKIVF